MQSLLVTWVGLSLLCPIDSLFVDRTHNFESPKDAALDDDVIYMSGVPVYHADRALKHARAKRSFLMNTTVNQTPDVEDDVSWICIFSDNTTDSKLKEFCPQGSTGEGPRSVTDTDDGKFKGCKERGDLSKNKAVRFLHVVCKKSQLETALGDSAVKDYAEFCEGDMQVHIDDLHRDYSQYLIDENENLEAATWGLNRINKDSAPAAGFGVHVYVLDTGVMVTHSQFEGRAVPQLESLGWIRKCECQNSTCSTDTHGHGTHCAGTVAGVDYGVAPQARIHSVKVLGDDGYGFTSWSIAAESWILSNGMRPAIVSMSLGGAGNNFAEKNSLDALYADGVVVVVAAGNEADDACNYNPAWIPNVITTGSTTSSDGLSWFSNYGTCVDILAPGSSILSAGISSDTSTAYKSGTSMACPHVSGAAAILFALNKDMTPAQHIAELLAEAEDGAISSLPSGTPNKLLQVDSISGR